MICGGCCRVKDPEHRETKIWNKTKKKTLRENRNGNACQSIVVRLITHSKHHNILYYTHTTYATVMHIPEYNKNRTTQYYMLCMDVHIVRIFRVSFFFLLFSLYLSKYVQNHRITLLV